MSAIRRDRHDLPWYEESRVMSVFVLITYGIIEAHQVSIETDSEIVWVKF